MKGAIIALLIASWGYLIAEKTMELVFLGATNFLFWWYMVFAGTVVVLHGIIFLIAIITGTAIGAVAENRKIGALLGFLGGSILTVFGLIKLTLKRLLLIFGAYALRGSVVIIADGSSEWNMSKVVFGATLLAIGLIMSKKISALRVNFRPRPSSPR